MIYYEAFNQRQLLKLHSIQPSSQVASPNHKTYGLIVHLSRPREADEKHRNEGKVLSILMLDESRALLCAAWSSMLLRGKQASWEYFYYSLKNRLIAKEKKETKKSRRLRVSRLVFVLFSCCCFFIHLSIFFLHIFNIKIMATTEENQIVWEKLDAGQRKQRGKRAWSL